MKKTAPANVWDILVVCTGNMCRSPLAAAALRAKLVTSGINGVVVRSAGTLAPAGHPATPEAVDAAESRGLDISYHRTTPLDKANVRRADLILVMEAPRHIDAVIAIDPDAEAKTFLLSDFSDGPWGGQNIPDPIGISYGFYEVIFDRMSDLLNGVIASLAEHREK